jgi:hypothetical protein
MTKREIVTIEDALAIIEDKLASFQDDPADSDFQRGYQAALEEVLEELYPQNTPATDGK